VFFSSRCSAFKPAAASEKKKIIRDKAKKINK
jgi:hypothetical protein